MFGGVSDYVQKSGPALAPWGTIDPVELVNPNPSHEFAWGFGEIIGALLAAGLSLEVLREYPFSNGCLLFDDMVALPGRRFALPKSVPELPLMFGLVARR